MVSVQQGQFQNEPGKYFDLAASGEEISIPWKDGATVAVISGAELRELRKARHNLDYLLMLQESSQQILEGRVVVKTMEELEAMANE